MCTCVCVYSHVCTYAHACVSAGAPGAQKRTYDPLKLNFRPLWGTWHGNKSHQADNHWVPLNTPPQHLLSLPAVQKRHDQRSAAQLPSCVWASSAFCCSALSRTTLFYSVVFCFVLLHFVSIYFLVIFFHVGMLFSDSERGWTKCEGEGAEKHSMDLVCLRLQGS